jgi:hypothetical protein
MKLITGLVEREIRMKRSQKQNTTRNTATKLSETEILHLQNIGLRRQLLEKEYSTALDAISRKYGNEGEQLQIAADGALVRSIQPAPPPATPAKP